MGIRIKDVATRAAKLLVGNAWLPVDNGTSVEKVSAETIMKETVEEYAGTSIGGTAQTIKSALDAMNEKALFYFESLGNWSALNLVQDVETGNSSRFILFGIAASAGQMLVFIVSTSSSGNVSVAEVYKGENVTYAKDTRCLTITRTSNEIRYLVIRLTSFMPKVTNHSES